MKKCGKRKQMKIIINLGSYFNNKLHPTPHIFNIKVTHSFSLNPFRFPK